MSLQDWQNIGGATGGRLLARHLGHLRLQATGVHTPDLLQENEDNTGESMLIENYNLRVFDLFQSLLFSFIFLLGGERSNFSLNYLITWQSESPRISLENS